MILFPPPFVKFHYPGYFWNTEERQLYSIKVGGVLKKLSLRQTRVVNGKLLKFPHYNISVRGKSKCIRYTDLLHGYKNANSSALIETVDVHG